MTHIQEHLLNVTLYSTGCPKCEVLKQKLGLAGIQFTVCSDVDKLIDMGFDELPVLSVGGVRMNFAEAVKWINKKE